MTIGLLLAEPWTPVSESRATTIAAASPAVTTSSTSSPAIVAASNLTKAARTLPASAQSTTWVGPPATKYAVIDLGPFGSFDLADTISEVPPHPDRHGTMGINNHGEVVYARNVGNVVIRAFVWLPNANYGLNCGLHDLNALGSLQQTQFSIARDINDAGFIVGQHGRNQEDIYAHDSAGVGIVWELSSGSATVHTLPYFEGEDGQQQPWTGTWVAPHAINDEATPYVVGMAEVVTPCLCDNSPGVQYVPLAAAFYWELGACDLEHLHRSKLGDDNDACASRSEARDVNSEGANNLPFVVGRSFCDWIEGVDFEEEVEGATKCLELESTNLCDFSSSYRGNVWFEILGPPTSGCVIDVSDYDVEELRALFDGGDWLEGSARGINDFREAVGFGRDAPSGAVCPRRALFWELARDFIDPVVLGDDSILQEIGQDGDPSRAEALNNSCRTQVVGWNELLQRALRWTLNDPDDISNLASWEVLDLTSALRECDDKWLITEAHDINDEGWIAAIAMDLDRAPPGLNAVLLIPVPHQAGDVNFDGIVDVHDLQLVIANWGNKCTELSCTAFCGDECPGDANGDCQVNVADLLMVISNWGRVFDPCRFEPDIACYTPPPGQLPPPGPVELPFQDVLDDWNLDDWDDAEQWLQTADPQDVQDFLDDLEDAANQM